MKDETLLSIIASDPERGLGVLMRDYTGLVACAVRGKLSRRVFSEADIEDCVSDSFNEFYLGLGSFDPKRSSIASRLCIIARNNATDMLRRKMREGASVSLENEEAGSLPCEYSLECDLESREERRRVFEAVNALKKPDREIILMKYYMGLSSAETAKALHMTVSNVDTRAHRAVRKLRNKLGGENNEA